MNRENEPSIADVADRHRQLMAFAMLAMALLYLASAAIHVAGPEAEPYLDVVVVGMAILMLALSVPIVYWKARKLPSRERFVYFSSEGYVAEILGRAHKASWGATLLLLVLLATIADNSYLSELPGEFYMQFVLAVMLGVMSLVFLYLNRTTEEQGVAEGADA